MLKIIPLFEGSFSVNATKEFVPFQKGLDDPKTRPGSIFVHVQPFLIESSEALILLDAGLGQLEPDGTPQILKNIRKAGYNPDGISEIVLSHLHSDHVRGLVLKKADGNYALTFPSARITLQQGELDQGLENRGGSYPVQILEYLNQNANVLRLDGDYSLSDSIDLELSGGHTPNHQVVHIHEQSQHLFFGGDVLPESDQLIRNYIAKYDFDGRRSMELRKNYGARAAFGRWTCLFYHDHHAIPFAQVRQAPDSSFQLLRQDFNKAG